MDGESKLASMVMRGKTEALLNGEDAVRCWLETARKQGRKIPHQS
jgi:predicted RNase H-like HicB family nuclease